MKFHFLNILNDTRFKKTRTKKMSFVPIERQCGERSTRNTDTVNALLREGGKLTCSKMNANICRFLLSACTLCFFKTFGLLKLQADKQQAV